jgi:Domain of unknown function (DUF4263)
MNRTDKWAADDWRVDLITTGEADSEELWNLADRAQGKQENSGDSPGTVYQLFKMAKEIIFDVDDDNNITLTPMTWVLNTEAFQYVLTGLITGTFDTNEEVKLRLASALVHEVPVVPNNEAVRPRLEAIFADLIADGFQAKYEGKLTRLALTEKAKFDPEGEINPERLVIQPAEVGQLTARLREERAQNAQAKSALARLTAAEIELRDLLTARTRNEHALQRCLTKYPLFFGPSYRRVIPKHKLGDDYVTDYALEHVDGSVDVMEIEASTHRLYKKKGGPTVPLVHAEQQVLNWLEWLDKHSPYAREKLAGVRRASGFVVIGCRDRFRPGDTERLHWRNMMYSGRLTVLTYEDLLDRCLALQELLSAQQSAASEPRS